ncbi:von willebrand factor type A domain protein (macronuclear) [Tetrahymena thermophila SB210]|uniref:von willebrand factor type A domain protein n=1 Tax=Tetrahymena thermophila (strain SB210) TaxID=312017 RepID=W7X8K5_TETTS|nr:von willebrand factor type A domain protein [Tetrahymena thermophila SB210]EWS72738.1 von willebrand factor type A domain protein [Tetrahymena thermophila SB210]|eukprot:XP_012654716.1 von willebrand factor type A domain protein [Tetrahymena thermophila SB210]
MTTQLVILNVLAVPKYVIKIIGNIVNMQEEKNKINTLFNVGIDLLHLTEQELKKKICLHLQHAQTMKIILRLNIKVNYQNGVNLKKFMKRGIGMQEILKKKKNYQDRSGKSFGSQLKCKQQISPMHFIIAFDESGSMNGKNWQDLRAELENFINLRLDKSEQDFCTLIGFNDKSFVYSMFENLNKQLIQKIPQNNHGDGTNYSRIFDSILQILNHQKSKEFIQNTVIFFLTDGVANKPDSQIQTLLTKHELIKEIMFIGYGNHEFKVLLQMVSDLQNLNATFYKTLDQQQLSQQFENLSLIIPS